MSNKNILWIGCGGCLSFLILAVIVIVAIGSMGFQYAQKIEKKLDAWEGQSQQLDRAYPFSPPESPQTDEERYAAFLRIREQIIVVSREKLGWLFEFMANREEPGRLALVQIGLKFIHFFSDLGDIGIEMIARLDREKMSMKEYKYLTRLTMGTLYHWGNLGEDEERKAAWNRYISSVEELSVKVKRIEENQRGSNIDLGPLDRERILGLMQSLPALPLESDEILFAHRAEITASTMAIFTDAFIVEQD